MESIPDIAPHLCECGCGRPTEFPKKADRSTGRVIGRPNRFVKGHNRRWRGTIDEWFLLHVEKTDGCWLWTGNKTSAGYGIIRLRGRIHDYAHRYSWQSINGSIPEGLEICHDCDTPACVRPDHLFLGTHGDNMADASRKGRMHPGEHNYNAKLTDDQVRQIRKLYTGKKGQSTKIARLFPVSRKTVEAVGKRKTWRSVE